MRKKSRLIIMSLLAVAVLAACSVSQKKASKSSSTEEASSAPSSSTSPSTEEKEISVMTMDIDSLMQGNYDSILGTWQNSQGENLVFNSKGLVSEKRSLLGRGKIMEGIFETGYVDTEMGEVILLMVPKEVVIPSSFFIDGEQDPTDLSKDRLFVVAGSLDAGVDAFYKLPPTTGGNSDPLKNTETGIQLESGPKTIEYATTILGENGWEIVEGNYTRTDGIPYNVIEGDDNSHYSIYQNGVIVNADYKIVYQP